MEGDELDNALDPSHRGQVIYILGVTTATVTAAVTATVTKGELVYRDDQHGRRRLRDTMSGHGGVSERIIR